MPSKSIAQQRFMGLVKSAQAGKAKVKGKAKKAAKEMKPKDVDDFASTKHKGLPYKVKQETKVRRLIRKIVREIMKEGFAGAVNKSARQSFDATRRKQSEVLGYKLTGKNDMKVEIDDATIKEGKLTEDKFIAFYKKDRVTVNAKSLWDAKKQIIAKLKVPKKDVGLVSVLNKTEYDKQKFRFEGKLTEGKETIFDVAFRVMKNKSMENYKSQKGMVKVDMQSANLLTKVFKKVNPKMKKILSDLGYKNPAGLMNTLWAVVK